MKKIFVILGVTFYLVGLTHFAFAGNSADEAKTMVEKAVLYFQANGKEKALKEFNNPKGEFVKGELYIVGMAMDGTVIAHPFSPKLVGINNIDVPDVDGKLFRKEIVETAKTKGSGWMDYKFKNPTTNKVEAKTSYFKKAGDSILVCGTYK
jgi:cytochrome c